MATKTEQFNLALYKNQSKEYKKDLVKIMKKCLEILPRDIIIEVLKKRKIIKRDWEERGEKYKLTENKK